MYVIYIKDAPNKESKYITSSPLTCDLLIKSSITKLNKNGLHKPPLPPHYQNKIHWISFLSS